MPKDEYELDFRENDRGDDPVAWLDDGTAVFPDRAAEVEVRAGERWRCRIIRKGDVAFAYPLERVDPSSEEIARNPNLLTKFLATPEGRTFRNTLERHLRVELREQFLEGVDKVTAAVDDMSQRLADLEEEVIDLQANAEPGGESRAMGVDDFRKIKKPVRGDGPVTDDFIERKILYQLCIMEKWDNAHTSERNFHKGQLNGVDRTRINDVVARMVREGTLRAHGKRPDEQYALEPDRKAYIEERLGYVRRQEPDDEAEAEAGGAQAAPAPTDSWVGEGVFENTVRVLRERLDKLEANTRGARTGGVRPEEVRAVKRSIEELEGRAGGVDATLQRLQAMVEEHELALEDVPSSRREKDDEGEPEVTDNTLMFWDLMEQNVGAGSASFHADLLDTPDALEEALGYVQRFDGWFPPISFLPGCMAGIGEVGRCVVDACDGTPARLVPTVDGRDVDKAKCRASLMCDEHASQYPLVVALPAEGHRGDLDKVRDSVFSLANGMGVEKPPTLTSRDVYVIGDKRTRRRWEYKMGREG